MMDLLMRIPALALAILVAGTVLAGALSNDGWNMSPPLKAGMPPGFPFATGAGAVDGMTGPTAVYFRSLGRSNFFGRNGATLERKISPEAWRGKHVSLALRLKREGSVDASLWAFVDKRSGVRIKASPQKIEASDWQTAQFVLDVPDDATAFAIDLHLFGTGTVWIDRVDLEAVGAEVALTGSRREDTAKFPPVPGPILAPWGHPDTR